jgi:hypothetical protein
VQSEQLGRVIIYVASPVAVTDEVRLSYMVGQSNSKKCRLWQAYLQAQYRAVGIASFEFHILSLAITT